MKEKDKQLPQFKLKCIKTDCPGRLIPNVIYTIDPNKKFENKPSIFWYHPLENKWVFIGYEELSFFDTSPIKRYINNKKGIEEPHQRTRQRVSQPQRTRQAQPSQRIRSRQRKRSPV